MLTLEQIQEKKQLIQTYQKIYAYVFNKAKKIIIIGVSILLLFAITRTYKQEEIMIDPVLQSRIKATFIKQKDTTSNNPDIVIFIKGGKFNTSGNIITTDNSLIQYKGFIVPRFFSIYKTAPISDITTINKGQYSVADIDAILQNIIFAPIQQNTIESNIPNLIPLGGIEKQFTMQCIYNVIGSSICNTYVRNFLENNVMYNWIHAEDIEKVHKELIYSTKRKTRYCESIDDHVLYNKTKDPVAQKLSEDCPENIKKDIEEKNNFREIQDQLKNKNIQNTVYKSINLNIYKLVSMQQAIYNDTLQNKTNPRYIEQYIAYIQTILKKQIITGAYIDMTYYYNNAYLLPYLYTIQTQNPSISNTNAIENIIILNKGSSLLGFTGLEKIIKNNKLIEQTDSKESLNTNVSIEALMASIKSFPYIQIKQQNIQIKQQNIQGDTIDIQGSIKLTAPLVENKTVDFKATLKKQDTILYVESIEINDLPSFNQAIDKIIQTQNQKLTIRAVYQIINDSIGVYIAPRTEPTLCDRINQIISINIILCGSSQIRISKSKSPEQIYTISLSGDTITAIDYTDSQIAQSIQKFVGTKSDFVRLPTLIASIIDTKKENNTDTNKISQINIIRINDRLQQFLKTKLDDISYYNDIYFIQCKIGGINFIGKYDMQTYTLTDLYFKDVMMDQKPIAIKNINLTLSPTNQDNIDSFVNNPLEYIKNINRSAFTAYLQFSKQQ